MARKIVCFFLVQSFICKVLSIYAQPTIQQYLHLTGTPHPTQTITIPAQRPPPPPTVAPTNQARPASGLPTLPALALPELISRLQQLQTIEHSAQIPNQVANQARPTTGLPSFSALGLPNLVSSLQQVPQKPSPIKPATSSSIDSNVLNNLAIALQLLIVSNILNAPPSDSAVTKPVKEIAPCSDSNLSSFSQIMPNSNFVGSSGFGEASLGQAYKPSRNSMALLSPYEALGSVSSYSDPKLTQYGSTNPRQDFQSPYSMMTDKDLFSMNDLF